MNPVAADRLKSVGKTNSNFDNGTNTFSQPIGYKLNPVMQRLSDLKDSQFWGSNYNVYAWDINGDEEWHGSAVDTVSQPAAESEFFIYPHGRKHFSSVYFGILSYFGNETEGLRQKVNVLDPFMWSSGLALAAKDHVAETALNEPARRSSIGLHGSSPATRAAEYGSWRGRLTESIVYGRYDTIGVLAELLTHDFGYIDYESRWAGADLDAAAKLALTGFFRPNTAKFHQCS